MIVKYVHDNDPMKFIICVRDLMSGVVLPWHLDSSQKDIITNTIKRLDEVVHDRLEDQQLLEIMNDCVSMMAGLTVDSKSARVTHEKFERARFMIAHMRNALEKLLILK